VDLRALAMILYCMTPLCARQLAVLTPNCSSRILVRR